jgi:hypothetical protein
MTCLDLISNVTSRAGSNITVSVPPKTAYGFKLSPYISTPITTVNSNYVAGFNDRTIFVSTSGSVITLPSARANSGANYSIKLTVAGSCAVATTNSEKIDGATSYGLSSQYKYVTVQSDGAQWWVIASN